MFRVFVFLFSLTILGCGDSAKELPKHITAPPERAPEDPAAAVPKESDAEAKKLVQKCIAAATENHPERLEKLKVNRMSEAGQQLNLVGRVFVPTSRKVAAAWPDRFLFTDESNANGPTKVAIGMRQGSLTFRKNEEPFDPGFPKGYEQVLKVDSTAQHWMLTLVPLADPKTIVFNAKKQLIGIQPADTVQAFVPGCPVFTLWFDEKTSLLGLVTYDHAELGDTKLKKRQASAGHQLFSGVMLPTALEYTRGTELVESWKVLAWEFPEKIDDAVFDQKK